MMRKNMLDSRIVFVCLLVMLWLSTHTLNFAQNVVIKGSVTDQEGNPLKDVQIKLVDLSRGLRFDLKSDKNGNFMKVGIPLSTYRISAELEGYVRFESQIQAKMGAEERIIIKLGKIPPRLDEDQDFAEGADFFSKQQYAKAIASFEKVVEKFPSQFEGFYNLGLSYLREGHIDQAIVYLEKAIDLNPESYECYRALGESYFQKGESEEAASALSHAVVLQPNNPMSHYNLGLVYDKMNRPKEALQAYQKAIELKPDLSAPYYQAALAFIRLENYKGAIEYFEKFLELEPGAPETNQVKAMIEELKKR
jgi:tetratricopeptide (TPR) repeat protein